MPTIQWRPAVNTLTVPQSCKMLFVPRNTVGYEEMAADISAEQPLYSPETVSGLAPLIMKWIQRQLISGDQVTLEDAFTWRTSFLGKLNSPETTRHLTATT